MTKPFHIEELIARVNIQLRKDANSTTSDSIEFGDIRLNLKSSTLTCKTNNES